MNTTESLHEQKQVFAVGDQDFEAKILKSKMPMVVDFTAEWCPPCHVLEPIYERLSTEYKGRLGFAKVDIDEHPNVQWQFRVQAAPTLIFFKDGKEIERIVGPHPGRLKSTIDRILANHGIG
ncbi:MAG: thioredoxin [Ktedonobacteraceae bacterium]|nr:thioredoxin [Ktedonobacteraceae bacterium]